MNFFFLLKEQIVQKKAIYLALNFDFHQIILDFSMTNRQHLESSLPVAHDIFVPGKLSALQMLHDSGGKSKLYFVRTSEIQNIKFGRL